MFYSLFVLFRHNLLSRTSASIREGNQVLKTGPNLRADENNVKIATFIYKSACSRTFSLFNVTFLHVQYFKSFNSLQLSRFRESMLETCALSCLALVFLAVSALTTNSQVPSAANGFCFMCSVFQSSLRKHIWNLSQGKTSGSLFQNCLAAIQWRRQPFRKHSPAAFHSEESAMEYSTT